MSSSPVRSKPPRPPLTTTTSVWPAASVLILAVVVLASFMIVDVVTSRGVATTTTVPVVVGGLDVQTGTNSGPSLMSGCQEPENPPANIADAFVVPVGTRGNGPFDLTDAGAGEFNCYRPFTTSASASELLGFYQAHLEALGWQLFSRGGQNGAPQLLFQKAGTDTFEWVVGITVSSHSASSCSWTLTIYQNSGD